ncbi:MAG: TM1802 family CRISPR-associated protein [Thermodesulfobacteriota bacterium]|nr:TM1802 family CRISPR-associated protein [Thermodesulfobacteriota bacterium]
MSLAYKLWKIGNVLTEEDIWDAMMDHGIQADDDDIQYVNIDLTVTDKRVTAISLNRQSISGSRLFLTKKIGGTSNSYYLYPNLNLQKSFVKEKVGLLVNTLKYGMMQFTNDQNKNILELVLSELEDIKNYIERAEVEKQIADFSKRRDLQGEEALSDKDLEKTNKGIEKLEKKLSELLKDQEHWNQSLLNVCTEIVKLPKSDYLVWLSLNGKTFYELMPEIKDSWYNKPVIAENLKNGFDAFTNCETDIGYRPEVKVFSYDQYHDSMNHRLIDNLPLSLESARAIKFAWMYLVHNLVFYFHALEYVLIPNVLTDDPDVYRTVLNRFQRANKKSSEKHALLKEHSAQEKKLDKEIDKIARKKSGKNKEKLDELTKQRQELQQHIDGLDTGLIGELDEQIEEVGDLKHSMTIDYLFTKINRTNLSFEIKGVIEDLIPSRIRTVRLEMMEHRINDRVKLGRRNPDEVLLQDYFHRKELLCVINRSQQNNANIILQEKLYLARLLLTDMTIDLDALMARFEENRLYGYNMKKRLNKQGVYQWIENPRQFVRDDDAIFNFLKRLEKIKGKGLWNRNA